MGKCDDVCEIQIVLNSALVEKFCCVSINSKAMIEQSRKNKTAGLKPGMPAVVWCVPGFLKLLLLTTSLCEHVCLLACVSAPKVITNQLHDMNHI